MRHAVVLTLTLTAVLAAPAAAAPGPPLTTPPATLEAALECRGDVERAAAEPVLLVHGTGSTPEENWPSDYALAPLGHPVCTVRIADRATRDVQVNVEYVVHAIRRMAERRRGPIVVIGHSQGGTLPIVALKFWPDLAGLVREYVGLAPALGSPATGDVLCAQPCAAPFQQLRSNSVWYRSFVARRLPAGPEYTTIASRTDEIVFPQPEASFLEGASNILIQDLCPTNTDDHFQMATDGVVWNIARDAMTHPGGADLRRMGPADCVAPTLPGTDPVTSASNLVVGANGAASASNDAPRLSEEPRVRCYVVPDCADPDARGRVLASVARRGRRLVLVAQRAGTVEVTVLRRGRRTTHALRFDAPGTRTVRLVPARRRQQVVIAARPDGYVVPAVERALATRVR